jgi:putative transcriptional regulator
MESFFLNAVNLIAMTNTIRVERAILNITQAELAERVGVSRQTINAIESNKYVPSTILALKIARVFDKPVEQIFRLEKND